MPPLTEEQLQELLNQRFGQPQGIARLNPLGFQFENAFTPYSSKQMDALKTMRLPDTAYELDSGFMTQADPAFFADFTKGYDYDPYKGTKKDFNYLLGNTRPAFQYDTEFVEPAVKSGIETVDKVQGFVEDDDLEAAAIPEFAEGQLKQSPTGIARLFEFLSNLPTPLNLVRRGLESLSGVNQRLRNTDFGQSKTLQEYFQRREARKEAERLAPIQKQLREASERGGGYQPTSQKQNVARTASRVSGGKTRAYGL